MSHKPAPETSTGTMQPLEIETPPKTVDEKAKEVADEQTSTTATDDNDDDSRNSQKTSNGKTEPRQRHKCFGCFVALGVVLGVILIAFFGYLINAEVGLGPDDVVLPALESDDRVTVQQDAEGIAFTPVTYYNDHQNSNSSNAAAELPKVGLILIPGGAVEHESYALPARSIAEAGFFVAVPKVSSVPL